MPRGFNLLCVTCKNIQSGKIWHLVRALPLAIVVFTQLVLNTDEYCCPGRSLLLQKDTRAATCCHTIMVTCKHLHLALIWLCPGCSFLLQRRQSSLMQSWPHFPRLRGGVPPSLQRGRRSIKQYHLPRPQVDLLIPSRALHSI